MSATSAWSFPDSLQPRTDEVGFDLAAALDAVISLRVEVPEQAFTAGILGTERFGNGVVIGDGGLVLTIGYLITEARSIWLATNAGTVVPGHALAYDQATGFGLVQPLGRLNVTPLARGSASACAAGDDVVVIGHGGRAHALKGAIFAKREFAGYWEYLLDEALFTTPAHPQWGGTALVDAAGRLIGIGSLLLQEVLDGETIQGNMMVPVDLLEPILPELLSLGRTRSAPRPWLGIYTQEAEGRLVVGGLATGGPADRAGVKLGDIVIEVAGKPVLGLANFYRSVWQLGPAGVEVPLTLVSKGGRTQLQLRSADRVDFLLKPLMH